MGFEEAGEGEGHDYADDEACSGESHALAEDHIADREMEAEGHADADFVGAKGDRVGDDGIKADGGEQESEGGEGGDENGEEAVLPGDAGDNLFEAEGRGRRKCRSQKQRRERGESQELQRVTGRADEQVSRSNFRVVGGDTRWRGLRPCICHAC